MKPKNNNFQLVFDRLAKLGIHTQSELAKILNKKTSTISDAKRRGTFPKGYAEKLAQLYDKDINWFWGITEDNSSEIEQEVSQADLLEIILWQQENAKQTQDIYNDIQESYKAIWEKATERNTVLEQENVRLREFLKTFGLKLPGDGFSKKKNQAATLPSDVNVTKRFPSIISLRKI